MDRTLPVELQVCGLRGDELLLSVPGSLMGHQFRSLLRERLGNSRGTTGGSRVAVLHGAEMMVMKKTLKEQGERIWR